MSIVSVDSAMVYRGLNIGSGKPTPELLAKAPHQLIDIRDPDQSYSAAAFCHDARIAIDHIHASRRIPLLVGGTGLYFGALEHGLSPLPSADPQLRARLNATADRVGWSAMHACLRRVDPVTAAHVHCNDSQRIQRALEVYERSGQPLSVLLTKPHHNRLMHPIITVILELPTREQLHQRITVRFRQMLDAGLLEELNGLRNRYRLHQNLPSMRAVGYRQAWMALTGQLPIPELLEKGIAATRQLARRQLTWLRARTDGIRVDPSQPGAFEELQKTLQKRIENALTSAPGFQDIF